MEGNDNIMSILKSINPISFKFSKKNKELDKTFKSMSLQNLLKHLDYHPKIQDEYTPSPEFLKNKNKFEINFKNSNEYIKELSDLNNLPLIMNNRNCLKNGKFNEDYDMGRLSNKEEKMKLNEEKDKRKKERIEERLKKLKLWKEGDSNVDSLKYNPNYDFIKKKIYTVHIRPPSFKKIKKGKIEIEKNSERKKKIMEENNNNNNINQNMEQNSNQNQSVITFDKSKNENNNNNNNNNSNNLSLNFKEINKMNSNNSIIFNESNSNRSNSSKQRFQDLNNYFSLNLNSRNLFKPKPKAQNLKNRLKMFDKNSSINSDYNTIDINKSTNIEDFSLMHQDKEKSSSIQSMRNIISNKNIQFPKIAKKLSKPLRSVTKRYNEVKNTFYFKKMLGRKDSLFGEQNLNLVSYFPNYEFFRPHIPTTIFKYQKDEENYKKYVTGKIIRGYNYSPEKYFVFEYGKKKPKRLNLNRERLKMIEILKEKGE